MKRLYFALVLAAASFGAQATSIDISSVTSGATEVVASLSNTVQQSGVERFAPPPQPKGCNAGYMWSTAGGIAHCVPIPPPPPVVTAPTWTPPSYDPGPWDGGGGGSSTPVSTYTPDPAFQAWLDAYLNGTPSAPSPSTTTATAPQPEPPITWTDTTPQYTPTYNPPPPVVVAPAPPQEQYVWAVGSVNMGQVVTGYDAAAAYSTGAAYSAEQFNYVSMHYGNGDYVPYPVQTVSEFNASMAASGCYDTGYSGWQCR